MRKVIKVATPEPQYLVSTNITFAQVPGWCGHLKQDLKLDIVFPEHAEQRPCIIWICGGAWLQMSRCAHLLYLCELARSGFVVASVQYRTSNEAAFPAQLEDVKAAIRYLRANSAFYGIDPERFGVMGESAGAHLAAMTALTGEQKQYDVGDDLNFSSEVQAVCCWYPPTDLVHMPGVNPEELAAAPESLFIGQNVASVKQAAKKASPVHWVTKNAPPFLLLHGTDDHIVPFAQSEELYEKLEAAGADATLIGIEGADHADLPFFQKEVWKLIIQFFCDKL